MEDDLPPIEIDNSIFGGEPEIDMAEEARLHGDDAAAVWGDVAAPVQGVPPMQVGPMEFSTHNQGRVGAAGAAPPMQIGPLEFSSRRPRRAVGADMPGSSMISRGCTDNHDGTYTCLDGSIVRQNPDGTVTKVGPSVPSSTSAGFGFLLTAAGAGAGYYFGKWIGALGGLLAAGGARNLYYVKDDITSSDVSTKSAAMQRGLVGLVGVGAGAYLLYRSRKKG
jgi:hypothetical protein